MPRGRFADRVVTIALLVYGLVNVVTGIPSMIDYGAYVTTVLSLLGVEGELADPAAGRPWGIAAALVLAIGWLLTAYLSWRSLAKRTCHVVDPAGRGHRLHLRHRSSAHGSDRVGPHAVERDPRQRALTARGG